MTAGTSSVEPVESTSVEPLETVAARPPQEPPVETTWTPVCALADIEVEGGVAALVEGRAVAVFRTWAGEVLALSNYDPFSRASVLSRGIVGSRTLAGEAVPYVASPMHKQAFDLRSGQCLDDATVRVPAYDTRVEDGVVLVGPERTTEHETGTTPEREDE